MTINGPAKREGTDTRGLCRLSFTRWLPVLLAGLLWAVPAKAQTSPADKRAAIEAVSTDSLVRTLEYLTGERPVFVAGPVYLVMEERWIEDTTWTMLDRRYRENDVATEFIARRLMAAGYETEQFFRGVTAREKSIVNVIGSIEGTSRPNEVVIVGAHYDSVTGAPGADDNGTGTAAVLEVARILADRRPERTVRFALWDGEEAGLLGSRLYAEWVTDLSSIHAVLNADMLGWDGDGDRALVVDFVPESEWLAQMVIDVAQVAGIDLDVRPADFAIGRSDHASFNSAGVPAVLLIENFFGDFCPYYHSSDDRLTHINRDYYTEATRLLLAATMELAYGGVSTAIEPAGHDGGRAEVSVYPNPAIGPVTFHVPGSIAARMTLDIVDMLGRPVMSIEAAPGQARIPADLSALPAGVYLVAARSGAYVATGRLVLAPR